MVNSIMSSGDVPKLRVFCLIIFFSAALLSAPIEIVASTPDQSDAHSGFQCPGRVPNQPRPTTKADLGDVTRKARRLPKPTYPKSAKAAGAYGTVKVEIVIAVNTGSVVWAQVISGHDLLKAAVAEVMCGARFYPTNDADGYVSGFLTYRFSRSR